MVNVLYVYGDILRRGGMENHMMNYFRYADREKVHIDFAVQSLTQSGGLFDDEIRRSGSEIFILPKYRRNPLGYQYKLEKLFRSGRYQVVHAHCDAMNYRILKLAKKCGVPVRIAHSHNTQHILRSPLKRYYYECCRKHQSRLATTCWACSEQAGKWLFGDTPFTVIPNAIESDHFVFRSDVRREMRKRYGLSENDIVLGHVGRFDYQKNHPFMVELLKKLHNPKYKLLLIGDGWMRPQIEELVRTEHLESQVILTGEVSDPQKYYQMMDLLLLPSHFEGLGIAILEAQANGLPCLASEFVPREVNLFGSVTFCPLDVEKWVSLVYEKACCRCVTAPGEMEACGYNIRLAGKELSQRYVELVEEWKNQK